MPYIDIAVPVVFILWAAHWFPWPKLLGGNDLPRLATYTIGSLTIVGVPTLLYLRSPMTAHVLLAAFWFSLICAGAATVGAWIIDALLEGWHRQKDEDARYGK